MTLDSPEKQRDPYADLIDILHKCGAPLTIGGMVNRLVERNRITKIQALYVIEECVEAGCVQPRTIPASGRTDCIALHPAVHALMELGEARPHRKIRRDGQPNRKQLVLEWLARQAEKGATQSELARLSGIPRRTISLLITELESEGAVERAGRVPIENNQTSVLVRLKK